MKSKLTKEEDGVLRSMLHDARTLEPADIEREFRTYREQIDRERRDQGEVPYTDEDWKYLHVFYTLFFRQGFDYGVKKVTEAVNSATEYLTERLSTTPVR